MKIGIRARRSTPYWVCTLCSLVAFCGLLFVQTNGQMTPVTAESGLTIRSSRVSATPAMDVGTHCASYPLRPGFDANAVVQFQNIGTEVAENAIGVLVLDPKITYLGASVPPDMQHGDALIWRLKTLEAGFTQRITVRVHVPSGTPLGTPIQFQSTVAADGNDADARNNLSRLDFKVVGSFDPNDKLVWDISGRNADGPADPNTTGFIYQIRFQNTGTDTAFNVVIRDTLDPSLDGPSLTVGSSSHTHIALVTGGSNAEFTFSNIMLPDSNTNEPMSHGFVNFIVDLNPGLPLGTTITNRASIYFDFNAPVVTNTTTSILCTMLDEDFSFVQSGLGFDFTDLSDASATSWNWDFGDGAISTLKNPSHTYANLGNYNVCLTVSNFCRTETVCKSVLLVSAEEGATVQQLQLYPNPSAGVFQLDAALSHRGDLCVQVLDCKGAIIQDHARFMAAGPFSEVVDLSDQAAGLYLLRLEHLGKTYGLRLVKQ